MKSRILSRLGFIGLATLLAPAFSSCPGPVNDAQLTVAAPAISPAGGSFVEVQSVTIATETQGASVFYTVDGSKPTASSGTAYSGPINLSGDATVKAIALKAGWIDSSVASAEFSISLPMPAVEAPVFDIGSGSYPGPRSVEISTSTAEASIRYTMDGSEPTATLGTRYSGPVEVASNGTIKAIAFKEGMDDSEVAEAAYVIAGSVWTPRTLPANAYWTSMAFGDDRFVAIALYGETAVSTDGIAWTPGSLPIATGSEWRSVAYGNGTFIAISNDIGAKAATSTDGIAWTARSLPAMGKWGPVAFGNGAFIVISPTSTLVTSTGVSWAPGGFLDFANWQAVCYGAGGFVAIPYSGSPISATSPDGMAWTSRAFYSNVWSAIAYGSGTYAALTSVSDEVMTSPDGISWTLRNSLPFEATWISLVNGDGTFVAIASDGKAATSTDGIDWVERALPGASNWSSAAYGNGTFVAIAFSGTAAATSP
jgi:hypothetical protein